MAQSDLLQHILIKPSRRDDFLKGYGTGNPIQLRKWHMEKFGKSVQESYVENCLEFIVSVVHPCMSSAEARTYGLTLFNVIATAKFVQMEKDLSEKGPLIEVPEINPYSKFVEDLGFDRIDYGIMHGTLKYPPRIEGFYKLKNVKECVNFVIDRYKLCCFS
jgi:hypothetical protein